MKTSEMSRIAENISPRDLPDIFPGVVTSVQERRDDTGIQCIYVHITGKFDNKPGKTTIKYRPTHQRDLLAPALVAMGVEDTDELVSNEYNFIKMKSETAGAQLDNGNITHPRHVPTAIGEN